MIGLGAEDAQSARQLEQATKSNKALVAVVDTQMKTGQQSDKRPIRHKKHPLAPKSIKSSVTAQSRNQY